MGRRWAQISRIRVWKIEICRFSEILMNKRALGTIKTPPLQREALKKSTCFLFTSFRRKPESSVFKALRTDWTPVFTGETAENQFFHTFRGIGGIWSVRI